MPLIQPDNFLYFIVLFTLSIFGGTYLLFAYYINRLLVINTIVLFCAGWRVASEYYIQQIATYEEVVAYAPWHLLPAFLLILLQWIIIWMYVRPLRGWRWERLANNVVVFGILILPFSIDFYFLCIKSVLFSYAPERMEGYWQFTANTDHWYYPYYRLRSDLTLIFVVILALFVGLIRNPKNRLRQSFLFLSYLTIPVLYYAYTTTDEWNVPTTGILYVSHTLIISWYVSNYRLFKSNFNLITKDVFESVSDLIISTDPQLRITNHNARAADVFNFRSNNLIPLLEQAQVEEADDIPAIIQGLTRQQIPEQELSLRGKDQAYYIFSLKVAPLQKGDQLMGYTFLLTDLTNIRQQEQQLAELNATKDRIFSIIGHDLRKPALAFRGIGQKVNHLLKKEDYPTLLALGSSLEKSAVSLNGLLDNLLNWALQQQGALSYRPQVIRLSEGLGPIHEQFQALATEKNIQLTFELADDAYVFADLNTLRIIIRNLVDNAVKFTPEGGTIKIYDKRVGHQTSMIVADTGIGMSASMLADIFQSGRTQSRTGTAGEKGTGLGMNLVYEMVKHNHGHIEIDSIPNAGTTVTITLPYPDATPTPPLTVSQTQGIMQL